MESEPKDTKTLDSSVTITEAEAYELHSLRYNAAIEELAQRLVRYQRNGETPYHGRRGFVHEINQLNLKIRNAAYEMVEIENKRRERRLQDSVENADETQNTE